MILLKTVLKEIQLFDLWDLKGILQKKGFFFYRIKPVNIKKKNLQIII
jgi:hypothetical protein